MHKIKIASLFISVLAVSSIAIADYTPSTNKDTSSFQCSTSTLPTEGTTVPTAYIETSNRLVQGLCANGGNTVNGVPLGKVTQNGHLINLPVWWKEADGTVITLNDICFNSKADPSKRNFFGKNKDGHVGVIPENSSTSISCHEGCSGQKFDFGINGFC